MSIFRLYRTAFKAHTAKDASKSHAKYYRIWNAGFRYDRRKIPLSRNLGCFHVWNPSSAVDIMISVTGLSFQECYDNSVLFNEDGLEIRTIHLNDLKKLNNLPVD